MFQSVPLLKKENFTPIKIMLILRSLTCKTCVLNLLIVVILDLITEQLINLVILDITLIGVKLGLK